MQHLHTKLTQKYPSYHNWHQTKHHNKIHWGELLVPGLIIFILLLNFNPQINAQIADTEPPAVTVTFPVNNLAVAGIIPVSATASDNVGVAGVQFKLDGVNLGAEDTISPYEISLDTTTIADGTHSLSASARDTAGNIGQSSVIRVTVDNDITPPVISNVRAINITSDSAAITWITDEPATSRVEYGLTTAYGLRTPLDTTAATLHSVNLTGLSADTAYHYRVKSKDSAGNEATKPIGATDYGFTTKSTNKPPILASIGNKTITLGQTLTFSLLPAVDPDGDVLSYFAYNLPEGASFNSETRTFSWTPTMAQAGDYPNIHFEVTDGLSQPKLRDAGINTNQFIVSAPNFKYITYGHVSSKVFNWEAVEPQEGVFDFSAVHAAIKEWTDIGFKVSLHLPLSRQQDGYDQMIPSWLVPKIRTVVLQDGTIAPVFWDPVFLSYREKIIQATAEEFANDPNVESIAFGEVILDGYAGKTNRIIWHNAAQASLPEGEKLTDEKLLNLYLSHLKNLVDMAEKYFPDQAVRLGLNFLRNGSQQFEGVNPDDINQLGMLKEHPEDVKAIWELADYMTEKGVGIDYPGLRTSGSAEWRESNHLFPVFSRYSGHSQIGMRADFPDKKGWDLMDRIKQAFNFRDPDTGRIYPVKVNYLELFSSAWLNNINNGNSYDWGPAFEYAAAELKKHNGASDYEDITITVVADVIPPSAPTDLTAQAISPFQINLSWTASTDDTGVTGYNIYRCAGSGCAPTTQIATSAVNSYSNTGLTASTAYTYAVSAYDAVGNESAKSQLVSATTLSQFKPSDLNQDQKVDQLDFDILKQDWRRTDKPKSDLNQDGIVDSQDFGIMMSEWTR